MKTLLAGAIKFDDIENYLRGNPEFNSNSKVDWSKLTLFLQGKGGSVGTIISIIIPYVFVIAGLMLLFYLITGGFRMMLGANDEKAMSDGRAKITNALVGFLLLFVSYWLVQILQFILGFKVL